MHARKTRQRKKQHIQSLTTRADALKEEQLKLRQVINEKNTASILVGLFAASGKKDEEMDPQVEQLLLRSIDDIPDATKVPELPALHLPGLSKRRGKNAINVTDLTVPASLPEDGIDYGLLGKDRSQCTPAELDKIRRERNRMHAKRTRDRKRIFMEEMEGIIKTLEEENELLRGHLVSLGGDPDEALGTPLLASPSLQASKPALLPPPTDDPTLLKPQAVDARSETGIQVAANQIKSLLMASQTFEKNQVGSGLMTISTVASAVSSPSSQNSSVAGSQMESDSRSLSPRNLPPKKRQCTRIRDVDSPSGVATTSSTTASPPMSINTSPPTTSGTAIGA